MEKEKVQEILNKDNQAFLDLIKSIGLDNKKKYNEREFNLIVSFLSKTENFQLNENPFNKNTNHSKEKSKTSAKASIDISKRDAFVC